MMNNRINILSAKLKHNARTWKHSEGGNIKKYADGNSLIYNSQSNNQSLIYNPMITGNSVDDDFNKLYNNYKLSFPVQSVQTAEVAPTTDSSAAIEELRRAGEAVLQSNNETQLNQNPTSVQTNDGPGKIYTKAESDQFKQDMYNAYYKALSTKGIPKADVYAKKLTTKAIFESNWGRSSLSKYYNFGGIKDFRRNTDAIQRDTIEYKNGVKQTMSQPFRKFKNLDDYINYDIDFVGDKWNVYNIDPEQFFEALVSGKLKYATDPYYAQKLNNAYKQIWK